VKLSAYGKSDIGLHRTKNEDGFVIRDLTRETTYEPAVVAEQPVGARGMLLAVCDGIGGHHAGEIASSLALETLETEMQRLSDACPRPELFKKAVEVVNRRVWTEASARLAGSHLTPGVSARRPPANPLRVISNGPAWIEARQRT